MIGKIVLSLVQFYDRQSKKMSFKSRPVLVLGKSDSSDYTVLPISKVSKKENIDAEYDIPVNKSDYPDLGLKLDSYIRTHKVLTVNDSEITKTVSDLKSKHEDLYLIVLEKYEQYFRSILDVAI